MQFLEKIKKSIFSLIILILLIISFFVFKFAPQKEKIYSPKMSENQIFTDFKVVELIEEKQINFNKVLFGKNFYLINIWSSWCVPCRQEHPILMDLDKNKKIIVIGINYKDTKKNAIEFLEKFGNPYEKIFFDKEGVQSIEWGAYGVPESFIIHKNKILKKYIGPMNHQSIKEIESLIK